MLGRLLQVLLGFTVVTGITYYAASTTVHTAVSRLPYQERDPMVRAMAACTALQNTNEYRMAPLGGAYRRQTDAMCEYEKATAARAAGIAPRR